MKKRVPMRGKHRKLRKTKQIQHNQKQRKVMKKINIQTKNFKQPRTPQKNHTQKRMKIEKKTKVLIKTQQIKGRPLQYRPVH